MGELAGTSRLSKSTLIRAPLAPVAAALACGITAERFAPLPVGLWVVLGIAGLLTAAATLWREHLHLITVAGVAASVFCIGAVAAHRAYFSVSDQDIVTYTDARPILATIRGQVATTPGIDEGEAGPSIGYRRPPVTRFVLRAAGISTRTGLQEVTGLVAVTIRQRDDRLRPGQQVELLGWLGRIEGPDNPGQYDWSEPARRSGMLAGMTVPAADGVTILEEGSPPRQVAAGGPDRRSLLGRWAGNLRAAAREHLACCGDLESGQLVNALIIGERQPVLRSLNRIMMQAGVVHYLSISGAHLGVFLGFAYLLCRIFALTPRRSAIAVLVTLGIYMVLAEGRSPLLRSAIMAAALCLATIFRRPYSSLNALAGAMIILLAAWPMELFDAGFQLSFGIVAGLILLQQPARRWLFGRWLRRRGLMVFRGSDRGTPPQSVAAGTPRFRRWLYHTGANWLMDGATMAIVAYVVSIPLVAYHFGFFSPYAAPLSLAIAAPVLAVLIPGYLSMALAWPIPNLAYAIGRLADSAADGLAWMVRAMEELPGLSFQIRPVGWWWVLLFYAVVALATLHRRLRLGKAALAASVLVLAGATAYTQRTASPPPVAELNVLSVGGGQCTILRSPTGKTYILDAGTRSGQEVYGQVLWPFLRDQRLPAPTEAFISHANTDHYNALPELLRRRPLHGAYLNEPFGTQEGEVASAGPAGADLLNVLTERGVRISRLRAGDGVRLDDRTSVQVLWPPAGATELGLNDSSLVLLVTCDDTSVLLPGDIENGSQRSLVASGQVPHAEVLLLPHHGSWKPALPDFLAAVNPQYVLASNSREPAGPAASEQPRQFYERLRTAYRFYSTPRNGWIQVRFGRGEVQVTTMR
jgi:competence protein ComEC